MGLDLVGFRELKNSIGWCYSTFDNLRFVHKDAVEKAFEDESKKKKILDRLAEEKCDIEEAQDLFYNHSDCDGLWHKDELEILSNYLWATFSAFKEYVENDEEYMWKYSHLLNLIDQSDMIVFY